MRHVALPLAFALAVLAGSAEAAETFKSGTFDPPRPAPDFTLSGSDGKPIKMSTYRGKVVALAFGFTYCPRVCPVTLANLQRVAEKLGDDAKDLQVVFVSVDPERDTPARMKEFLAFFNPTFMGATGTAAELEAVRKEYGVLATRATSENPKLGYEVHHSSFIYLIDRAGNLRLLVPFGKSPDDVVHDVKVLLKP
ncbi:SCO family protein [Myxococcota bacterium]|nr:SCO family protein [Myxococcota bacterium]